MTQRVNECRVFQVIFWQMLPKNKKGDREDMTLDQTEFDAKFPAFAKAGWSEKAGLGAKPLEFFHEGKKVSVKRIA